MNDKKTAIDKFWSDRAVEYQTDPRANSNDVWIREVEIQSIIKVIDSIKPEVVLDFGCANGYSTIKIAEKYPNIQFVGCDININMIDAANMSRKLPNLKFICADIINDDIGRYDLVMATRVIQNIESIDRQKEVVLNIRDKLLKQSGYFYSIESYEEGYAEINADRLSFGLPLLPIQPHLTLLNDDFINFSKNIFLIQEVGCPSAVYYIVTRLVYSKFAKLNNEDINYNHLLHQLAAQCPQIGLYGPQRSYLYRNR